MDSRQYTPFPAECLPETLRNFVVQGASAINCDVVQLALPALCVCAGILGGSRRLQLNATWCVPPILWGCVLGESGTSKSPAMRLALAPLRERTVAEYERWEALKRASSAATSSELKPPRRVLVADTTTEALALIAKENPLGLLLARDELAGVIGSFDRYAGNGGGDEAFFLSAYDGESFTVDRKTAREHVFVPSMTLSIVGTCQPAIFARLMNSQRRESGLLARFLVVSPPTKAKLLSNDNGDEAFASGWSRIVDRLFDLEMAIGPKGTPTPFIIARTEEAYELYRQFYNAHNQVVMEESGDWRAFLAKAEQLPLRLALTLHHIQWAQATECEEGFDPSHVDACTMASAIELTQWFIGEARRVYGILSSTEEDRMQMDLEEWIRRRGGKTSVREVMRNAPTRYRSSEGLVSQLLHGMEKRKVGRWVELPDHQEGGPSPAGGFVMRHFELI
jgi:hypothetical protein